MSKLFFIPFSLLVLSSNISVSSIQPQAPPASNSFQVSSSVISPGATDNLLSDITITYNLKDPGSVSIKLVRDSKPIINISDKIDQMPGDYTIVWNGRDNHEDYIKDGSYELECRINGNIVASIPVEVKALIAKINVPKTGMLVRAQVPIFGIASGRNFKKYIIEYRGESPGDGWTKIEESTIPRVDMTEMDDLSEGDQTIYGNLATWDTGLTDYYYYDTKVDLLGPYTVRLTVLDENGNKAVDEIKVDVGRVISFIYGGTVESPDRKMTLQFAEHSIDTSFILFYIKQAVIDSADKLINKEGYKLISQVYEIEPEGINFPRPATLKMHYDSKMVKNRDHIGVYAYEPDLGIWGHIVTENNTKDSVLTAKINSTQKLYAYYAVFERTKAVSVPVIYDLPKKMHFNVIDIRGEAAGEKKVKIYINNIETGEAQCDGITGVFEYKRALLDIGDNKIFARAMDESGNLGPPSNVITSKLILNDPKKVYSIEFKTPDFKDGLEDKEINVGDSVFIELQGEDADKNSIDSTAILVRSLSKDPKGIKVILLETGLNTGVYRAVVKLSDKTNPAERTLSVNSSSDEVVVKSLIDSGKAVSTKVKEKLILRKPQANILPSGSDLCRDTFENGFDEWENMDGEEGASLSLDSAATTDKSSCLKLINNKYGGSFGTVIRNTPFDAEKYPIVSFDYKISPDVKINFLVKSGKRWYDIQFTDDDKIYERINMVKIGKIEGVICDNKWHHSEFNLYKMLKKYASGKVIEQMIMADYDVSGFMKLGYGHNREGAVFYLDNFTISKQPSTDTPSGNPQPPWEIGDNDNSNNEFLYEAETGDDYYAGEPFEKFERAVTKSDPKTNIHFYLSKENSQKGYNFFIQAKDWDVRVCDYVDFDILLNGNKLKSLKCPYKDGTVFNIKIDSGLKAGWNVLSLEWKGGGEWVSWDYLKLEPIEISPKKPCASWAIGYSDNSFNEFSHEMYIGDDYSVGDGFKNFERGISVQDPIINIKFNLNNDMLNTDYELYIKPFDIAPIDTQPKSSGTFFRVMANGKDAGTYNVTAEKKPLQIPINRRNLKNGENTITLEWLAGCDWIAWDYFEFGPAKK